nr:class I SAM-dependent methyltransferase [Hyphomicrobium sp.]
VNLNTAALRQELDELSARRQNHASFGDAAQAHRENLERRFGKDAIYEATLHRHLASQPTREIDFFINPRRFDLMQSVIGERLARHGVSILNAASGPFALEFYVPLMDASIDAFDIDEALAPLHRVLTMRALIAPCSFRTMNVTAYQPDRRYDIVLVNDLFYSKHVDFFRLIEKFADAVAPGGVLYFDIQDQRAGPVWRLLGKGSTTRRYDLAEVRATLERLGLKVEAVQPALGIKGGIDGVARRFLWRWFGIANNFAFAATR